MYYVLVATAVALGMLRIFGNVSASYQAAAHCFVGGMFAAFLVLWVHVSFRAGVRYGILALLLTALEVYCFLVSKKVINALITV
jgi:hypothetical protein